MKKEYMSPQAIVVKIHTQKMIAQSANGVTIMSGNADDSDALGRGGNSLWDDEEDEDY